MKKKKNKYVSKSPRISLTYGQVTREDVLERLQNLYHLCLIYFDCNIASV